MQVLLCIIELFPKCIWYKLLFKLVCHKVFFMANIASRNWFCINSFRWNVSDVLCFPRTSHPENSRDNIFYLWSNFSFSSQVMQHCRDLVINLSPAGWEPLGRSPLLRPCRQNLSPILALCSLSLPFCQLVEQVALWEAQLSVTASTTLEKSLKCKST